MTTKKNYNDRYSRIAKSSWFIESYQNKSLGDKIKIGTEIMRTKFTREEILAAKELVAVWKKSGDIDLLSWLDYQLKYEAIKHNGVSINTKTYNFTNDENKKSDISPYTPSIRKGDVIG